MTPVNNPRSSLKDHGLTAKKRFGQNFLVHQRTAEAIVASGKVSPEDTIIEVGVGLGAMTLPLAQKAKQVIGLEIDSGIIRYHEQEGVLPENVTLIHQDVLKSDLQTLSVETGGRLKIMANLPYSISNPFLFKLIENLPWVDRATIMVQKEVADRWMASPGCKAYGIPSVLIQTCARISRLMTLKPAEFHPRPKIDSVVILIDFNHDTPLDYNRATLHLVVRAAFSQRRKTLLNTLSAARLFSTSVSADKQINKELTIRALKLANLNPRDRAETLTLNDFIRLAQSVDKVTSDQSPATLASKAQQQI
ncbi:MAG: ribosomal RNA small subunit methyltransferase A [Desulfobulbaceae bacterium]|uniref:Ribosomal RNA small subunit methyltransferase A n=1 Tax=Candidatus Desulfatifera sulfidica TaxID=2841691 RepID=A0A8J6N587_9BACT|nr:ribosomal RNA small subunit methyltransferase A [Candidatus Desulfatifera sulfidica]